MLLKVSMAVLLSALVFSFLATYSNEDLRSYWSKFIITPLWDHSHSLLFGKTQQAHSIKSGVNWPSCLQQPWTEKNLKKYKHLVILGHVFDVSSNPENYGEGASYSKLTGRDASRAFVTGDFSEEGLTDSLKGLSTSAFGELSNWLSHIGSKYPCIGHLHGLYFDHFGKETPLFLEIYEASNTLERQRNEAVALFPACSSETSGADNTVYCEQIASDSAILRPRLLFEISRQKPRCACVHPRLLNDPRIREYPNCDSTDTHCTMSLKEMRSLHQKNLMNNK